MKNTIFAFVSLSAAALFIACAPAGSSTSSSTTGGGGGGGGGTSALTDAEVTGTHYEPCVAMDSSFGTELATGSYLKSINLNSNGTYDLSVLIFSAVNCQTGSGVELGAYNQFGTYALGSLSTSGATEVTYTTGTAQMTVYAASGAGSTFAGHLNSGCPGMSTSSFSTSATSSSTLISSHTCNSVTVELPQFPADGTSFTDLIALDSVTSPTTFTVYPALSIFQMGQFTSFPTTTSQAYAF